MKEQWNLKFEDDIILKKTTNKAVLLNDEDIKFYSNFIAYSIQCLFVAEK